MTPDLLIQRLSEASQNEDHSDLDYGNPGALVHYAERFWKMGYEECLVESVSRHPVSPTVGMLNRLVNGTTDVTSKMRLLELMNRATAHPLADSTTQECAAHYLEFHGFPL